MISHNPNSLNPDIVSFFETYPEAKDIYASMPLYHSTLGSTVPIIREQGLHPRPTLFPEEHGRFLLTIYQRYGRGHPSDSDYIQDRILPPGGVYLTTVEPGSSTAYGIPERLTLLMRGMHTLRTKRSLTDEERTYAGDAFDSHLELLTRDGQTITTLNINPMAPSVANQRFGRFDLSRISNLEQARDVATYLDGVDYNNIAIPEVIEPPYITEHSSAPLTQAQIDRVYIPASWADSIE